MSSTPTDDESIEPEADEVVEEPVADGRSRRLFSKLARRLRDPRELGGDALDLVGAIVESSDRAKTEMVRMVAREARHYLQELKLKEDLKELITGHSMEVHLSLSLKPLIREVDEASAEGQDSEAEEALEASGSSAKGPAKSGQREQG